MRIKSNFADYYDKIQWAGTDTQLFIRTPKEVLDVPLKVDKENEYEYKIYHFNNVEIAFCGNLYVGYQFTKSSTPISKYLYTLTEIKDFYESMNWKWKYNYLGKNEYEKIYSNVTLTNSKNALSEYFIKYHTPIMICDKERREDLKVGYRYIFPVTINGYLKPFNFQTVFPPQLCYQEISMFLGNMASPEKPIPHISDEILLGCKGFDKFSFRKDPSKRR